MVFHLQNDYETLLGNISAQQYTAEFKMPAQKLFVEPPNIILRYFKPIFLTNRRFEQDVSNQMNSCYKVLGLSHSMNSAQYDCPGNVDTTAEKPSENTSEHIHSNGNTSAACAEPKLAEKTTSSQSANANTTGATPKFNKMRQSRSIYSDIIILLQASLINATLDETFHNTVSESIEDSKENVDQKDEEPEIKEDEIVDKLMEDEKMEVEETVEEKEKEEQEEDDDVVIEEPNIEQIEIDDKLDMDDVRMEHDDNEDDDSSIQIDNMLLPGGIKIKQEPMDDDAADEEMCLSTIKTEPVDRSYKTRINANVTGNSPL